jgi:virginiamycin B lyase
MPNKSHAFLAVALGFLVCAPAPLLAQRGGRGGGQPDLPDGPGKQIVQTLCVGCHSLSNITEGWGYDKKGWDELIASMVSLPTDSRDQITTYLGEHFSAKTRPATVLVPGTAKVNIQEWLVPSLGSRPHDPLAASDGSIWWTGMFANVLGRLDPKTGAMKEFKLETPNSGPHGLTEDKDHNIWFTDNTGGYVGKLNPQTGDITEFKMPDPAARDPHTPRFDVNGNLWFSLQNANMVGRLNPQTGEIKLVNMPTPHTNPYGMVMTSKHIPVVCLFGTNKIASFDLDTMAVKEYTLPNHAARPRRIAITSDDMIWYADYGSGHLGRLNLANGEVKEWPSPSGPQSQPYGIIAINDIIWYNESAIRPNTLVRFDPKTEKFQSWAILPSGGGVVRNMSMTKEGNIAMAESGVNRVALVTLH